MREVRFSVGPASAVPVTNSWGGWPTATGLQPYLVLRATVEGEPDPRTGYLCNIAAIDRLVRERTIPLAGRLSARDNLTGEQLLLAAAEDLMPHAPAGSRWVEWQLFTTAYLSFRVKSGALDMIDVSQQFEFSAAHRLHCPTLSDEQNQQIFGKCNNPSGHGHNYRLEITITGKPHPTSGVLLPIDQFERIVRDRVVNHLDHKHLNTDCPEFATLNPSVENITKVIWGLLEGHLSPARLKRVRVWETPKTYAEYEAP